MTPRRGPKSLQQVARDSLVRLIILKEIPVDVLNKAPTHLVVAIMKHVAHELESTHKAAAARSSAMLKQKHCQLVVAERRLSAISRVFKRIWGMLTRPTAGLETGDLGHHYRIVSDRGEINKHGMRHISIQTTSSLSNQNIFLNEPVSNWGFEHWILSPSSDEPSQDLDIRADYMIGQTLMDGRTGRKVTDPFL